MTNNNNLSPTGAPAAKNSSETGNAVKGLAIGAAGAAAIAGAGGLAYAATKQVEEGVDANTDAESNNPETDNNTPASTSATGEVHTDIKVSMRAESTHHDHHHHYPLHDTPPHPADVHHHSKGEATPDPHLSTDNLQNDIILIDEADADAPGLFFDPDEMVVSNIDGTYVTRVESTLPNGDKVYLVDSDDDGSFDQIYDINGNIITNEDDVQMVTTDDVRSIMMDRGDSVTDSYGNEIGQVRMADVNETLHSDTDAYDIPSFGSSGSAPAAPEFDSPQPADDFYPEAVDATFDSGTDFSSVDSFDSASTGFDNGASSFASVDNIDSSIDSDGDIG